MCAHICVSPVCLTCTLWVARVQCQQQPLWPPHLQGPHEKISAPDGAPAGSGGRPPFSPGGGGGSVWWDPWAPSTLDLAVWARRGQRSGFSLPYPAAYPSPPKSSKKKKKPPPHTCSWPCIFLQPAPSFPLGNYKELSTRLPPVSPRPPSTSSFRAPVGLLAVSK